ncbi:hypothetical protein MAPG_00605 [Magnaporthiopsis poae ATCC 64411]|uniref:Uncharacterized protein n=1 Tax=Magnaporthiopsis poae (strain ATCC 64411 / 73-15) TaxID=644358 RepID=A0A0C4DLG3_MAGP6|nr:hypothetical protein MAPG_00605 [Magnaporthiopsis poae ATCC 64411]
MPDLNSVPPSPRALAVNRQQPSSYTAMPPPPAPIASASNILPSNQSTINTMVSSSSALASPGLPPAPPVASQDNTGVGPGPGPLRHPRPLTAAELHMQLEKEQEAVVNRLTRELSLLRAAQNASVVSNTSSTSASGADGTPGPDLISGAGFSIPSSAGRRHHRTSSSASARSQAALMSTSFGASSMVGAASGPLPAQAGRPYASSLSRQNSTTSRRSRASSPIQTSHVVTQPHSHHQHYPPHPNHHHHHQPNPADPLPGGGYFHRAQPGSGPTPSELSPGLVPATSRYEEVAFYRSELDSAKRENDILRRRIRELERAVRERRASDASRARSESVSTSASVAVSAAGAGVTGAGVSGGVAVAGRREGAGRERVASSFSIAGSVGVGVPEDEVRVGESAASAGLRTQPAP